MTTPNVAVRVSGEDTGVAATLRRISQQLAELERTSARAGASVSKAGLHVKRASADFSAFEKSQRGGLQAAAALAPRIGSLVLAYASLASVAAVAKRGLNVNEELESAALGIASIITAQSKLTDAQGKTLTGAEALNAAQGISADQLQKLRVAGLQTTATFQELAQAFQGAIGPGLAAGLDLDGVRQTVIGITQAAAALGVPTNQLNQEVRSILDGTIDVNSRVGKTLQITNAQVKLERERGTLQQFLNEKLLAFNIAGAKSALTFRGVSSNIKEALELFAGAATQPLFEKLKVAGQAALEGIFDFKTAKLAPAFQGIVTLAQTAFAGVGDLLASALAGAVDGAKRLSAFITENRVAISAFADDVLSAVAALVEAAKEAGHIAVEIGRAVVQSGLLSGALRTIADLARLAADVMKGIADSKTLLTIGGITAGVVALSRAIGGLSALPTALGLAGLAVAANPITAIAAALAGLAVITNTLSAATQRAKLEQFELSRQQAESANSVRTLATEYAKQARELANGKLKGEALLSAQNRLRSLQEQLISASPAYAAVLKNASGRYADLAKSVDAVTASLLTKQAVETTQLAAEVSRLQKEKAALEADAAGNVASVNGRSVQGAENLALGKQIRAKGKLDDINNQLASATKALDANVAGLEAAGRIVAAARVQGKPSATADTAATARANAKAAADAQLITVKDAATRQLALADSFFKTREQLNEQANARGLQSLTRYYAVRAQLAREATAAEIAALTTQRTALIAAPIVPDAPGADKLALARAKRAKEIADLEDQITLKQADGARTQLLIDFDREKAAKDLAASIIDAEAKIREARGETLDAALTAVRREAEAFDKLLIAGGVSAPERTIRVKVLLDVLTARAQFAEIERDGQQALDSLGRERQRVNTLAETGTISQTDAQRQLLALERLRAPALREIAARMSAIAAALGPEAQADAARFADEVDKLGKVATRAQQLTANVLSNTGDALESALGDTLSRLGSDITTLQGAIASLATSAVQSVQRIIGALLAAKLREGIGSLFGGGETTVDKTANVGDASKSAALLASGGTAVTIGAEALSGAASRTESAALKLIPGSVALSSSAQALNQASRNILTAAAALAAAVAGQQIVSKYSNVVKGIKALQLATGGYVRGPGTSTSDSIPARLSAGEYVINARAVRKIGVSQLDAINTLRTLESHRTIETRRTEHVTSDSGAVVTMRPMVVMASLIAASLPMLTHAVTVSDVSGSALLRAAALLAVAATALARRQPSPVAAFARGGVVHGAGTSTSDSIPARLSVGEYVLRAAAVRTLGVAQLDAWNFGRSLRAPIERTALRGVQHFAEGGLVQPAAAQGARSEIHATIGLDDGLILRSLTTRAGERVILDAVKNNPRLVKAIVGT